MKKSLQSVIIAFLMVTIITCSGLSVTAAQTRLVEKHVDPEPEPGVISISGNVYGFPLNGSGSVPLPDAKITIIGGKLIGGIHFAIKQTTTNGNGNYEFENIPIGVYLIIARKAAGYMMGFRLVLLTENNPIKQNADIYCLRKLIG